MKRLYIIATAAIVLSGCASTPTGSIEAFSASTVGVTDKIDAVISDYNKANINDQLVEMALDRKKHTASDFDPIKDIIIKDSDKKDFALYKANKALGDYAKSLSALATAGSREELAMAGVKLSKALKGMNAQYKILKQTNNDIISDKNSGTISRVISELTTFYVQNKRANALKDIILSSDESVQTIGRVINEQLLKGVIEGRLYTMRNHEINGYFSDYNAIVADASFTEKKKMLDELYEKYIVMQSTTATVVQAQQAITSIMMAHAKIKSELEENRFTSKEIIKAISEIKTVHKSFDDLEELILTCETEIISDAQKGIICK